MCIHESSVRRGGYEAKKPRDYVYHADQNQYFIEIETVNNYDGERKQWSECE